MALPLYSRLSVYETSGVSDQDSVEDVAIRCTNCSAIYPAMKLPDGTLTRSSHRSFCRCGSDSFVELTDND